MVEVCLAGFFWQQRNKKVFEQVWWWFALLASVPSPDLSSADTLIPALTITPLLCIYDLYIHRSAILLEWNPSKNSFSNNRMMMHGYQEMFVELPNWAAVFGMCFNSICIGRHHFILHLLLLHSFLDWQTIVWRIELQSLECLWRQWETTSIRATTVRDQFSSGEFCKQTTFFCSVCGLFT